jgi:hypothetical protein
MRISSSLLRRVTTAALTAAVVFSLPAMSATAASPAVTGLSVNATAQTVSYAGTAVISGRLVRAADNAPLPGGRVYLQQWVNGWTNAGSVVTDANGNATAYAIGVVGSRSWTLYWPGNATFAAARSAVVAVSITTPTTGTTGTTQLTVTSTAQAVPYGGAASFTGRLSRASDNAPLPGGRIYLQQWVNGWVNAGSVVTDANGNATAYAVGLTTTRSWTLFWPGNAQFPAARTAVVSVTVAAPVIKAGLRLTFYYPWFPDGLDHPGSNYHPSDGAYSTADPAELAKQVAEMRYAGLNGAIFSWSGQADVFSQRLSTAVAAAHGTPFRWSAYYEPEGQGNPSVAQIQSDLNYLYTRYATDPNWLTIGGRPVIFVWPDGSDNCAMLDRWAAANADHRWYVVQKVIYTQPYRSCASQPDAWHEYAPANRTSVTPWSFSVSPGFWRKGEAAAQLTRSASAFDAAVQAMKVSGAQFQLVTTWNEWIEGTSIESAQEWASPSGYGGYVDILHNAFGSQ